MVNVVGLVLSTLLAVPIGMLWFGPLLGQLWLNYTFPGSKVGQLQVPAGRMALIHTTSIVSHLLGFYVYSHFLLFWNVTDVSMALFVTMWVNAFLLLFSLDFHLYRMHPWYAVFIDRGYTCVILSVSAVVMTYFGL